MSASATGSVVRAADFSISTSKKNLYVQRARARLRLVSVEGYRCRNAGIVNIPACGTLTKGRVFVYLS